MICLFNLYSKHEMKENPIISEIFYAKRDFDLFMSQITVKKTVIHILPMEQVPVCDDTLVHPCHPQRT